MIDIDTSWEWIAMYGPVQYSTVQYSTVQYITTVIIDTSGHGHRSQVTVTVTGHRSQVTGQRSRSQVTGHGHSGKFYYILFLYSNLWTAFFRKVTSQVSYLVKTKYYII